MTDKWAEHKQKFCGCKDASRLNRCQGRNNCELPEGHPERVSAAPRQPEGEGLEVVAWQDAENPLYTTAERRVLHDWANNGYPIVELCRLSDHQRAIAELREELDAAKEILAQQGRRNTELRAELDTLRQQLAERDAEILEQCRLNGIGAERELKLLTQRDKLAGLLREVGDWIDRTSFHGTDAVDLMQRIDAALAEVKPCPESPAPTT